MEEFLQFYRMTTEQLLRLKKKSCFLLMYQNYNVLFVGEKTRNKYKYQFSYSRKFLLIQSKSFSKYDILIADYCKNVHPNT